MPQRQIYPGYLVHRAELLRTFQGKKKKIKPDLFLSSEATSAEQHSGWSERVAAPEEREPGCSK